MRRSPRDSRSAAHCSPSRAADGADAAGASTMGTTWIVCANSSRARLFEVDPHGPHGVAEPREIADYANPAARAHERDLRSDAAGRYYGKGERTEGHVAAKQDGF